MSTEESNRLSVTQGQSISLYLDHYQGGSEPGLNGVDNLYIPTSSLAICFFVLDGSGHFSVGLPTARDLTSNELHL